MPDSLIKPDVSLIVHKELSPGSGSENLDQSFTRKLSGRIQPISRVGQFPQTCYCTPRRGAGTAAAPCRRPAAPPRRRNLEVGLGPPQAPARPRRREVPGSCT